MTLKLMVPVDVTPDMISATTVSEVSNWNAGTTYQAGAEVESATTHRRYRSVASGNIGHNPETPDSLHWQNIGATNRMRAFDKAMGQFVENSGGISYTIDVSTRVTGAALIGVAGGSVRVRVHDTINGTTVEDHTREVVNTDLVRDWYGYFLWEAEPQDAIIFSGLKGFAGNRIIVDIIATGSTARVGQICLGREQEIGTVVGGGEVGYESFSAVTRDEFGSTSITERGAADRMEVNVFVPIPQGARPEARLRRLVRTTDAVPTLFFDEELLDAGILAFGHLEEASIPLIQAGGATFSLDVRGIL